MCKLFFFIFDTFIDTFEKINVSINGILVYGAKIFRLLAASMQVAIPGDF